MYLDILYRLSFKLPKNLGLCVPTYCIEIGIPISMLKLSAILSCKL